MKLIAIEEHISSPKLLKVTQESQQNAQDFFEDLSSLLTDVETHRLPFMDETKVSMQILSLTNPTELHLVDCVNIPNEERNEIVKNANNYLKRIVDTHPDRFAAFATLPLWDVAFAAEELERCVKELGFKGALVTGKFAGHFLDEKQFIPLFQKAEELDVPIYFHPSMPIAKVRDYYYKSAEGDWSNYVGMRFGSVGFGWHMDIGIQMVRMILSGIFDKCPKLQLITGHWGEVMVPMLDRLDYMLPREMTGLKKNISDYYRTNIYITPSGINSPINMEATVKYLGADRILWATDYPYVREKDFTDFLLNSNLTQEQKELIAHKNAEKLFKL